MEPVVLFALVIVSCLCLSSLIGGVWYALSDSKPTPAPKNYVRTSTPAPAGTTAPAGTLAPSGTIVQNGTTAPAVATTPVPAVEGTTTPSQPAPLEYNNGRCVHPEGGSVTKNGVEAVFYDGCDPKHTPIQFEMTEKKSIRHKQTGKCLHPKGGDLDASNNTSLIFHDGCDEYRLAFEQLPNGAIRHITSGKCIHPKGGVANNNTGLVLYEGCGDDRAFKKFGK